ncbi:MFS transporter [Kerstersia gyiorum]|uniref:MFS transporter n=1 Tax=Kerstersia gyiorum TaxID=206506 RepID=UPI00209D4832|nr:MFS transporter [Kerstersia gyiorum]MCP1632907.1 MFS family permease [Kerstersia gyiorum]MCP1682112.1 MFS family permease [Kerstersia gyiorum]MCP1717780.1 MFS family permease [Kerstersia gyiorum]MCW2186995.1 MFS family permease [Kerstersia gyiorum]
MWRILPLSIICVFFSHLDRINISFAKNQMQAELGLSDAAYGIAAGVFFVGYVLFEVPSSIGLRKYGAPNWVCRIMVSWGLATSALMFANSEYLLYVLRFLIGVMEAGFAPALLFYLAAWFPRRHLAKVNGLFFLSLPLAGALGGPVSGLILEFMDGTLGLQGWHWLFLITGLPCCLVGLTVLKYFDKDIDQAKWLSAAEKHLLKHNLEQDNKDRKPGYSSIWKVLFTREVVILATIYFTVKMASYGLNFWMPNLIAKSGIESDLIVGILTMLPYAAACIAMVLITRRTDATGNQRGALIACVLMSSIGYLIAISFFNSVPLMLAGLILATIGSFVAVPLFCTIPQTVFSGLGLATGFAAINSVAQLSGLVSPVLVGWINDITRTSHMGMLIAAPAGFICVGLILAFVPSNKRRTRAATAT